MRTNQICEPHLNFHIRVASFNYNVLDYSVFKTMCTEIEVYSRVYVVHFALEARHIIDWTHNIRADLAGIHQTCKYSLVHHRDLVFL